LIDEPSGDKRKRERFERRFRGVRGVFNECNESPSVDPIVICPQITGIGRGDRVGEVLAGREELVDDGVGRRWFRRSGFQSKTDLLIFVLLFRFLLVPAMSSQAACSSTRGEARCRVPLELALFFRKRFGRGGKKKSGNFLSSFFFFASLRHFDLTCLFPSTSKLLLLYLYPFHFLNNGSFPPRLRPPRARHGLRRPQGREAHHQGPQGAENRENGHRLASSAGAEKVAFFESRLAGKANWILAFLCFALSLFGPRPPFLTITSLAPPLSVLPTHPSPPIPKQASPVAKLMAGAAALPALVAAHPAFALVR